MVAVKPSIQILPREELQAQILHLNLEEMEVLLAWLKAAIKERKRALVAETIPLKKGREVVETRSTGKITYRLEKVKCGKKKCKCNKGQLHGPYWYAYTRNGKKLSSTYVGKTLEEFVAANTPSDAQPEPSEETRPDPSVESCSVSLSASDTALNP